MRTRRYLSVVLLVLAAAFAWGEGTRSWTQSKYEEFEKGTAKGVAISKDGSLELAPSFKPVLTTQSSFVWSLESDGEGNAYLSAGAPARIYRVTPDGKTSVIFEPPELQVQSMAMGPKGALYAATSPDGRVYRIERRANKVAANGDTPAAAATPAAGKATLDPGWTSSVFFEPKTKYIWDLAVDGSGRVYVATGDHGEIFRVDPDGKGSLFFKSDEAHIRVLAFDPAGNLIAGSDGSGLIYRISPAGKAFVLYSAPKKEISTLAVDKDGNIFAAGVGEKRAPSTGAAPGSAPALVLPHTTATAGAPGTGTPAAPGAPQPTAPTSMPPPMAAAPMGSEVYRIAPDGSPRRIWTSRDEVVYSLGFDARGHLLAGTGNKGRIYLIDREQRFTDRVKASATQVTGFAPAPGGGVYVSTSNLGKLFLLGRTPDAEGSYESDVYDAHIFSHWGRPEVRAEGDYELWARSGNVDNPDRNWSPWERVDVAKGAALAVPAARFLQWKMVLHPGTPNPVVHSVRINYLPKNVAPVIDEVQVLVGGETVPARPTPSPSPIPGAMISSAISRGESSAPAAPERGFVTVRWNAHDDNDDRLIFSIYYRGDGETRWKLLRSKITAHAYTFEAGLLPDGGYTVKVVASDAPSHSPDEALTDESESQHFEVDTTPPRIDDLHAAVEHGSLHVTFRASEMFSPIKRAEYSVDAGDWQYVEPVGTLSDSQLENYDFFAPLPAVRSAPAAAAPRPDANRGNPAAAEPSPEVAPLSLEHLVVVRVWDRFNNMASAKTVVHAQPAEAPGSRK